MCKFDSINRFCYKPLKPKHFLKSIDKCLHRILDLINKNVFDRDIE